MNKLFSAQVSIDPSKPHPKVVWYELVPNEHLRRRRGGTPVGGIKLRNWRLRKKRIKFAELMESLPIQPFNCKSKVLCVGNALTVPAEQPSASEEKQ